MTTVAEEVDTEKRPWWRPAQPPKPKLRQPVITLLISDMQPQTPTSLPFPIVNLYEVHARRALEILTSPCTMSVTRRRHLAAVSLRIDRHTLDDQRRVQVITVRLSELGSGHVR